MKSADEWANEAEELYNEPSGPRTEEFAKLYPEMTDWIRAIQRDARAAGIREAAEHLRGTANAGRLEAECTKGITRHIWTILAEALELTEPRILALIEKDAPA